MDASVSLVLNAQGLVKTQEDLLLHYSCPASPDVEENTPTGLQSWPMIFRSSPNKNISEPDHWPNIVSLIIHHDLMDKATTLAPHYHFEPHLGTTYFLANVEKRVMLVCILGGRRNAADPAILDFVNYVQAHLSNRSVYLDLQ